HLLGDVGVGADQADRSPLRVALDGRSDRNPAGLAVARTNDPVLHIVVANLASDGVAEFLFGGFSILGVNAADPILVGLVGRFRRQPVNQQVLRRPAIAETGSEVDLEATDPADLDRKSVV